MMDVETASPLDFSPVKKTTEFTLSSRPSLSYWQDAWIRLKKNRQALASLIIVIALMFFTIFGPWIWTVDPSTQELSRISEPPSMGRLVLVLPEETAYEEVVVPGHEESPTADGATLAATTEVKAIGIPSVQGVRFQWAPVKGASGYSIYRNQTEPKGRDSLGVPLSSIDGGNRVSFDDGFDLQAGKYYYTIVAKNLDESNQFKTLEVDLKPGISLSDAMSISPDAKVGEMLKMGPRPLGTDYLGRDMLARLMFGARVSLFIGFFAPFLYVLVGILIGGISGYFGGKIDNWMMRITDFVLALPFLLFMILFKIAFGAGPGDDGIFAMLVALVVLSWTGAARLTRGQVLQLRESEFVQASRLLGAKPLYLIVRHLLPNTLGVILVYLTFAVPSAIFTEAFLSFIGMGVAPPTPSWGSMCNDGIKSFLIHPHEFIFPAVLISITVLAFNLLGDGLRDALDPKMRSQS